MGSNVRRGFLLCAVMAWFIVLRPQQLGGPASYIVVSGTSMDPGLHPGDLVVVVRAENYVAGDIVAYRIPEGQPASGFQVIHRIVGGDAERGFIMRGDNTNGPDQWHPTQVDILGRELVRLPAVAQLLMILRNPLVLAGLAGVLAAAWLLRRREPRRLTPSNPPRSG
jgi:signal peptidase I